MLVILAIFFLGTPANSDVSLNIINQDHMVLQKADPASGTPAAQMSGLATALNETIVITGSAGFGQTIKTKPQNRTVENCTPPIYRIWWNVTVPAPSSGDGPFNLTISAIDPNGKTVNSITIHDVVFGDVFLCSGQSNMVLPVSATDDYAQEQKYADGLPNIRMWHVYPHDQWDYPVWSFVHQTLPWYVASSTTIGGFSAVCWDAGRNLAQWFAKNSSKTKYIGLLESNVGGTTIHFWAPSWVGTVCNSTGMLPHGGEAGSKPPGVIYNAMIHPFGFENYAIRSATWYQGEADSGENDRFPTEGYACEMTGLITGWRQLFQSPKMPFVIVQLPNGGTPLYGATPPNGWRGMQEAQNMAFERTDNTGLVTTHDQGCCNLHYVHKSEVGRRVSLWQRKLVYGDAVNAEGPRVQYPYKTKQEDAVIQVQMTNVGSGLKLVEGYRCTDLGNLTIITDQSRSDYQCCIGGIAARLLPKGVYTLQGGVKKLWDWIPAAVTVDPARKNTLLVKPYLPLPGAKFGGGVLLAIDEISFTHIEFGINPRCVVANGDGLTLSPSGPYHIYIDPLGKGLRVSHKEL